MLVQLKAPVIEYFSPPVRAKAKLPEFAHPETSPSFFKIDGTMFVNISTAYTVVVPFEEDKTIKDMFFEEDALNHKGSFLACDSFCGYGAASIGGAWTDINHYNSIENWKEGNPYWKRQYCGIFDARMLEIQGREYLLCIVHGENKNEMTMDKRRYINNIQPKRDYLPHEFSGPYEADGQLHYSDYDASYFAFLSMLLVPKEKCGSFFGKEEFDCGPIAWPHNGYIDKQNVRVNSGIRHPSLFVWEDYVYVYYLDQSQVRVIRAHKDTLLGKNPFQILHMDEFEKSSLPEGFDKHSRSFFTKGIGEIDALFEEDLQLRFSVAKVKGRDLFLGVEEYYKEWPVSGIRFRTSKDLIHWSEPISAEGLEFPEYNQGTLHYPILFDKDFTSRDEVDLEDFIVLGIFGNNIGHPVMEYRRFKLSVEE